MAELNLNQRKEEKEVLKINVGEESFSIPLASSLPLATIKKLKTKEDTLEFLLELVPEHLHNVLSLEDFRIIMDEWIRVSKEAGGITLGESQASRGLSKTMPRLLKPI